MFGITAIAVTVGKAVLNRLGGLPTSSLASLNVTIMGLTDSVEVDPSNRFPDA
jgi:hypothetical protein